MNPRILHIETSGPNCSVALSEGEHCLAFTLDSCGDHNKVLALQIQTLLRDQNIGLEALQAISVNEGPGSYTGLRIGVVMAKSLCYSMKLPLLMVSGLKALASYMHEQKTGKAHFLALIDARRDEVYFSCYNEMLDLEKGPLAAILDPEWLQSLGISESELAVSGSGADKWLRCLPNSKAQVLSHTTDARDLILPALRSYQKNKFQSVEEAIPFYLKDPNITQAKEKLISH